MLVFFVMIVVSLFLGFSFFILINELLRDGNELDRMHLTKLQTTKKWIPAKIYRWDPHCAA